MLLPPYLFTDRDRSKGMFLNNALPCPVSPFSHAAFLFKVLSCYLIQMDANLTPSLSPPPLILHRGMQIQRANLLLTGLFMIFQAVGF